MAEKADKKDEKGAGAGGAPAGGGHKMGGGISTLIKSTPALLGMVMVIEAVVLFAGFKMLGGPKPAQGAELSTEEPAAKEGEAKGRKELAEIPVVSFKAPNQKRGRSYLYDVGIYVTVKSQFKERVEAALRTREATIQDRIRTIVAHSDPEKLGGGAEPGLETLRRQVKFQLDEVLGDGLIEEVLIPRCIPYRSEF